MTTASAAAPAVPAAPLCFDSHHEDVIFDYYGRRLATASSDRTVRIFQADPNQPEKLLATLAGHEGPVWQVAWAHPKFGSILASCSYDGSAIIWKETSQAPQPPQPAQQHYGQFHHQPQPQQQTHQWIKVKEHRLHESSVNSISWAPHEFGLILACGSSDGQVSTVSYDVASSTWESRAFAAHQIGCNAVAWCPSSTPDLLAAVASGAAANPAPSTAKRLVSGGCDNLAKVWRCEEGSSEWTVEAVLEGHSDWVRDVAWAPALGATQAHTIATCSQDKTVLIWKQAGGTSTWSKTVLSEEPFKDTVWRLSWSVGGGLLAVSCGDNTVSLWRESGPAGTWECISTADQNTLAHQ